MKKSFTVKMVKHWNRLLKVEEDVTFLGVSKVRIDRILNNLVQWKMLTSMGLG